MTTSGVTSTITTARDAVQFAMQEAQVLASGEEPTAEEYADGIIRLNALLKSWETRGWTLWRQDSETVATVGGVNPTTLPAYVYDVEAVRYVVSATHERPLTMYERDDYQILPNKAQAGYPSIYYANRQRDAVDLAVWPVPATVAQLSVDFIRKIEVVTDGSETLDVPQDWHEALVAMLAIRLCTLYGKQPTPELVSRANALQREIDEQDRPTSYFLSGWNG